MSDCCDQISLTYIPALLRYCITGLYSGILLIHWCNYMYINRNSSVSFHIEKDMISFWNLVTSGTYIYTFCITEIIWAPIVVLILWSLLLHYTARVDNQYGGSDIPINWIQLKHIIYSDLFHQLTLKLDYEQW